MQADIVRMIDARRVRAHGERTDVEGLYGVFAAITLKKKTTMIAFTQSSAIKYAKFHTLHKA